MEHVIYRCVFFGCIYGRIYTYKRDMKLLYLKFDDPASLDEWKTKEQVIQELSAFTGMNETIGWLIAEDDKNYYLSAHKAYDKFSASLKVPKGIVMKKKIIKL